MTNPIQSSGFAGSMISDANSEIERRLATILQRFPERFSSEHKDDIRDRVSKSVAYGATLAGQHLGNGIGPAFDPRAMNRGE